MTKWPSLPEPSLWLPVSHSSNIWFNWYYYPKHKLMQLRLRRSNFLLEANSLPGESLHSNCTSLFKWNGDPKQKASVAKPILPLDQVHHHLTFGHCNLDLPFRWISFTLPCCGFMNNTANCFCWLKPQIVLKYKHPCHCHRCPYSALVWWTVG